MKKLSIDFIVPENGVYIFTLVDMLNAANYQDLSCRKLVARAVEGGDTIIIDAIENKPYLPMAKAAKEMLSAEITSMNRRLAIHGMVLDDEGMFKLAESE